MGFTENGIKRATPPTFKKFLENNKGINGGRDLPSSYLENTYERVLHLGYSKDAHWRLPVFVKSGWLLKQGKDLLKMWKKRYFLVGDRFLYYFKHVGDPEPISSISLTNITIIRDKAKKNTFLFHFQNRICAKGNQNNRFVLTAESDSEVKDWIDAILLSSDENSVSPTFQFERWLTPRCK